MVDICRYTIVNEAYKPKTFEHIGIYEGFYSHGGTPSSLDGLFRGKSIYKWMIVWGTPWIRKPPYGFNFHIFSQV